MPGEQPGVRRPGHALLWPKTTSHLLEMAWLGMLMHMLVSINAKRQHQWPELCEDTGVSCKPLSSTPNVLSKCRHVATYALDLQSACDLL